MLFINIDDFYQKAKGQKKLSREEEKHYAIKKDNGDADAHNKIMQSYLPMVACRIRCVPKNIQSLHTVYRFLSVLDDAVNRFDFLQDKVVEKMHIHSKPGRYFLPGFECTIDKIMDFSQKLL